MSRTTPITFILLILLVLLLPNTHSAVISVSSLPPILQQAYRKAMSQGTPTINVATSNDII